MRCYLDALLQYSDLDEELVRRCRNVTGKRIKKRGGLTPARAKRACNSCVGRFICWTIR